MTTFGPAFAPTFAVVVRPEPENDRTARRLEELGVAVRRLPLFERRALPWAVPDGSGFDALLLTSAAAVRLAGDGLERLRHLPAVCVGPATAAAARRAGLNPRVVGEGGAVEAVRIAREAGLPRLLHLAGRDRVADQPGVVAVPVYAAEALPIPPGAIRVMDGGVVLLHSPRAAARLARAADGDGADRARLALAALSPAVLAAAGPGWALVRSAATPSDAMLCRLAAGMIRPAGD